VRSPNDLTLPARHGRIDQVRGEAVFPQFLEGQRGTLEGSKALSRDSAHAQKSAAAASLSLLPGRA